MTPEDVQEEAGILDLACAQLGAQLANGRIRAAVAVHERLGAIVRRLQRLEAATAANAVPKVNGAAEP